MWTGRWEQNFLGDLQPVRLQLEALRVRIRTAVNGGQGPGRERQSSRSPWHLRRPTSRSTQPQAVPSSLPETHLCHMRASGPWCFYTPNTPLWESFTYVVTQIQRHKDTLLIIPTETQIPHSDSQACMCTYAHRPLQTLPSIITDMGGTLEYRPAHVPFCARSMHTTQWPLKASCRSWLGFLRFPEPSRCQHCHRVATGTQYYKPKPPGPGRRLLRGSTQTSSHALSLLSPSRGAQLLLATSE